jgi:hypothetical protein
MITHTHENPHAGQGSVLLDIGGDIGALVVEMPASMAGVEVEIRPVGAAGHAGHHPHVAVVERPTADGVVPSLVYPELVEGSYELYEKGTDRVELTVSVDGGAVTDARWPAAG